MHLILKVDAACKGVRHDQLVVIIWIGSHLGTHHILHIHAPQIQFLLLNLIKLTFVIHVAIEVLLAVVLGLWSHDACGLSLGHCLYLYSIWLDYSILDG